MSSALENLLEEISSQSPSGDEKIYSRTLRESLISLRKPEIPNGDADTGYRRSADWNSIVEISTTALTEQTKDIRIVCHLVEAWTQIRGFEGLADGLSLLTDFVDICWDRCNPPIEDGDTEVRTAPIENMLDDASRGICFPTTIRQLPLLGNQSNPCDYLLHERLQKSSDSEDRQQLSKIVAATDTTRLQEVSASISQSLENLQQLKAELDEKLGSQAPGLTYLRSAIEDCQRVTSMYCVAAPEETLVDPLKPSSQTTEGAQVCTSKTNQSSLDTRDAAYQQLTHVADYLQQIEPHSPIPYLVHRAVKLGRLPFPELMQQLVREEGILNELRREFGINEEETAD